jgi:two-component system, chemotaxis family, CheB/CheR fusion protein
MPRLARDTTIVAIGASAGGIEALSDFLRHLPPDTGMAFVSVQHLDPTHHSILTELLARETAMRVVEVSDGMRFLPNHLHVIPPNAMMSISKHTLHLSPRADARAPHMSVDHFMRALAQQHGNRAIGIILSGTGSDGTLGIAEIQSHGGVTFAQDVASAKYDGMPRSAVATGRVDYVLPPKGIADELARLAHHPYVARKIRPDAAPALTRSAAQPPGLASGQELHALFQSLRRATGVDFTDYRKSVILRRIQRRMLIHKIDKLADFVHYVQTSPEETRGVYNELLINVTSFFRNPRVFEAMKSTVFPAIYKNQPREPGVRVWVPGCASGEEVYSAAIALLEFLSDRERQFPMQFFGTDVSELSIAKARQGVYPENIQSDVSPERLRRYFDKVENGYRVSKAIRDVCIFAQHNLLDDPPLSQMDLVCCRNLLIYLEPQLQNKMFSLFHYALRPGGFLVLGAAESIGGRTNLFAVENRADKIFSRKDGVVPRGSTFTLRSRAAGREHGKLRVRAKQPDSHWNYVEAQKEFDRRLLSQYAPATVFVNEDMDILHSRGNVNRYLKLAPGRASLNLLKMARYGLLAELRVAIVQAKRENTSVGKRNLEITNEDEPANGKRRSATELVRLVNFDVVPVTLVNLKELYFMVVFQDAPPKLAKKEAGMPGGPGKAGGADEKEAAKLKQELSITKEYLQSIIDTQEASNEELQCANEEILSSNEELQSTKEEIETAKEELESSNEELSSLNDELQHRNQELARVNNDFMNLFSTVDLALVMIGKDLTVRRFTAAAENLLGLGVGDIGRPLANTEAAAKVKDLAGMVRQVMSDLPTSEQEFNDDNGARHVVKILPYRTMENKIDGALITITDAVATHEGRAAQSKFERSPC